MAMCPLGVCCVLVLKNKGFNIFMRNKPLLVTAHEFWVTQEAESDTALKSLPFLGKESSLKKKKS